ncbi:MAG: hypothetical protein LBE78_11870 [Burkholderiaceae bacterium]|nr:hypothetical protein [Burkholderiaceae bacterium]
MKIDIRGFDSAHLLGGHATHSPAPLRLSHAALLVLAGMCPPRPRALPGLAVTALASAFNCRF